ncbi:MAG: Lrp/AsnC family transcriptional regulator [Candidatus Hodarchaeales archaeon]|jgi:DNA-binding Lrp family transcriptional regulator
MDNIPRIRKLDDKDNSILKALSDNARLNTNEIYQQTKIPQTTVYNRIKKLEIDGVIEKFTIKLNKKLIGRGLSAYIFCTISYRTSTGEKISQPKVARQIKALPEVDEVAIVTGETDLIIKVSVADVDDLNSFVVKKLRDIEGVEKTITSVVLSEV